MLLVKCLNYSNIGYRQITRDRGREKSWSENLYFHIQHCGVCLGKAAAVSLSFRIWRLFCTSICIWGNSAVVYFFSVSLSTLVGFIVNVILVSSSVESMLQHCLAVENYHTKCFNMQRNILLPLLLVIRIFNTIEKTGSATWLAVCKQIIMLFNHETWSGTDPKLVSDRKVKEKSFFRNEHSK